MQYLFVNIWLPPCGVDNAKGLTIIPDDDGIGEDDEDLDLRFKWNSNP